jgi:hypothetical protein
MKEISFEEFVKGAKHLHISEFVDVFFNGEVSKAAAHFNVSRQTMHKWINSDDYEVETVYCKFDDGKVTHDYILKKQIKRVGAISTEIYDKIGYIYAISNGEITKIGCSKNPKSRIKDVALKMRFKEYDEYISNPTDRMRSTELAVHKSLSSLKYDNLVFPTEVFSCSIECAIKKINSLVPDIKSGPRLTNKAFIDKLTNVVGLNKNEK